MRTIGIHWHTGTANTKKCPNVRDLFLRNVLQILASDSQRNHVQYHGATCLGVLGPTKHLSLSLSLCALRDHLKQFWLLKAETTRRVQGNPSAKRTEQLPSAECSVLTSSCTDFAWIGYPQERKKGNIGDIYRNTAFETTALSRSCRSPTPKLINGCCGGIVRRFYTLWLETS